MPSSDVINIANPGLYEIVQRGNVVGTLRCEGASQEWQLLSSYLWPGRDAMHEVATTFRKAAAPAVSAPDAEPTSDTRVTVTCENEQAEAFPIFDAKQGRASRQIDPGFEQVMQGGAMVGLVVVGNVAGQRVEHWFLSSVSATGVAPFTPIGETEETTLVFRMCRSSTTGKPLFRPDLATVTQNAACAAFLKLPGLVHLKAPCLTHPTSVLGASLSDQASTTRDAHLAT